MTDKSGRLRGDDIRAVLRLVAETSELLESPLRAAKHVVDSIPKRCGAHVAIFGVFDGFAPGVELSFTISVEGGETPSHGAKIYQQYRDHEFARDVFLMRLHERGKLPVCVNRPEVIPNEDWFAHPHVNVLRRRAGVGECLYALARVGDGTRAAGFGWHRAWGEKPFSARQCAIARLLHESLSGLYSRFRVDSRVAEMQLSPALQRVLLALESGQSEKAIAQTLRLSRHTVRQYAKQIYARFSATSRPEFLARRLAEARAVSIGHCAEQNSALAPIAPKPAAKVPLQRRQPV